jgi:hypothetical protein
MVSLSHIIMIHVKKNNLDLEVKVCEQQGEPYINDVIIEKY